MNRFKMAILSIILTSSIFLFLGCGTGPSSDDFEGDINDDGQSEAAPADNSENDALWECTINDLSQCRAGAVCISGVCVGGI